ncbi:mediator of DNA damage checkpoint protein 1 [Aphelocoma coerulescens]|uniref:mediator of DNA damage checkpoint protein 1 n=1 Tax=Aphelocoma coerulescens TaxID=39617 RepID=UPI0036052CF2
MAREGALEDPAVPPDVEGPPKRLPCPRNAPDVAGEGPDPDVGSPETPRAAQNAPGAPDVGQRPPNPGVLHPKIRAGMLLVESDTDVEEEEEADPDVRPSGRRKVPRNVPGAPDVQPEAPSPDVVGLKNGRGVLVVESDTDVEEEEEEGGGIADPDVEPPKRLKMTQNVPGTPDVRRKPPNPDVLRPKIRPRVLLVESDTDVEGEEADPDVRPSKRRKMPRNVPETPDVGRKPPNPDVPGPKSGHRALLVESDTDVEEEPDVEPKKRLQMTQNVPETPDVQLRTPNPDVPGPKSSCRALLVESDTDVEEEEADPDVRTSEGREMPRNVPETPDVGRKLPNPDVSHPKVGRGALLVESDTDVEEDPDVEPPKLLQMTQSVPETPDVAAETPSPDVPGPRNGLGAQLVGSDTDVEADPDVEPPEQVKITQSMPGAPDVGRKLPNPDVSHPETRAGELLVESDTDVEEDPDVEPRKWPKMTQSAPETPEVAAETPSPDVPSPQNGLGAQLGGSDTDVEEDPDVEPPKQLETTQNVPGTPDVGRKLPNPDVSRPKMGRGALLVESDTDVEEDPDVGASERLQMPQSVPETPDVAAETPNPDVPGPRNGLGAQLVESDTDVEEDPDVGASERLQMTQSVPETPDVAVETTNPDVSGPKMGLLVESDTDVEEDPDVEPPERLQMTQNDPGAPDVGAGSPDPAVEATQLFPGPDPDVEGEEPDPDVRPLERLRMAQNDPGAPDVGPEAPDPDVGSPQRLGVAQTVAGIPDVAGGDSDSDSDLDPDVAATQLFLPPDPDVGEAEADPDVGRRPERLRRARSAPGIPDVEEEEEEEEGPDPDVATQLFPPPDPDVGPPKRLRTSRGGRGVPDVEEEEESDPDVATQLFLPPPDVGGAPEGPGIPDVEGPGSPSPDPDVATQLFPPPDPDVATQLFSPPGPDVGGPEGPRRAPNKASTPDVGAGSLDPDVEEGEGFDVATQLFPAPHPDVEEGEGPPDPDVATQLFPPPGPDVESPKAAAGQPRAPDVRRESPNPDVGGPPGPAHQGEEAPPTPQVRRSLRLAERRGGGASAGPSPAERGRGQAPRPRPSPKPRPQRRRSQSGEGLGEAPPSVPIKGSGRGSEVTPPPQEEEPAGGAKRRLRPRPAPGPAPIRVLFTGLVASPALLVALGTLGGTEATSVHDCSHLVTDGARRTLKLLCALARGVPIVTPEWLLQSSHGGRPLSPAPFLPRCPPLGLRLRPALARARRQPLLQGYGVHVTPSVRPRPEDIRDIVTCCGGTFLPRLPRGPAPRVLVVSCPQDRALWAPAVAAGLPLLSAEQLLAGVLQQRLALPRPPKPPQKPPQKTPQKPPQKKSQKPPQKPPTPPQTPPERPPPQFGSSTPPPSPPRTRSGRRPPQNPPRDPPNSWTPRNPTPNTPKRHQNAPKRHQNAPKRPRARSEGPEPFLGGSTPPQSPPRTRSGRRTPQNPPRTPRNPPKKTPSSGTAQKTPNVPQNARKRPRDPPEGDFGVPELPPSPPRTRSRRGPPQSPQ